MYLVFYLPSPPLEFKHVNLVRVLFVTAQIDPVHLTPICCRNTCMSLNLSRTIKSTAELGPRTSFVATHSVGQQTLMMH